MPGGIPYIVGNEAAERFSFYGMRAILVVFMTQYLIGSGGLTDVMGEEEAKGWFHLFVSAVYVTPLLGALLSDGLLGKYRTIILLSLVYCAGHFALAIDDTRWGLAIGLGLIALGAGGIKPCVSAHVGDQFGQSNRGLLSRAFAWFYFAINLGAFVSSLATPWLLETWGSSVAFGVPGVLMLIATLTFRAGRHRFVHIPPGGMRFVREAFSSIGLGALGRLCLIYVFVAMFWALFDQTGSSWVLQAQHMDRVILGLEVLPAQIQAANQDRHRPVPDRGGLHHPDAGADAHRPGRRAAHRLAAAGLRGADLRRGHGVDHLPGVFLYAGAEDHEVVHHGLLHAVHFSRQPVHQRRELFHPQPGRQQQAGRCRLLPVLHPADAANRDAVYARRALLPGRDLYP
jgi:hypothetical protein